MSKQRTGADDGLIRVKLWDPLLRVFHWALVLCVVGAWVLGKFGPSDMTLHFYLGYGVIGLLVFRIIWGLVGSKPARFAHFIYGPKTLFRYLAKIGDRKPSYWPGHNPVGALSVFALLVVLMSQAGTGLFADAEDYINVGPLVDYVDTPDVRLATKWHHRLSSIVLILVGLHLAAIAFYKVYKREDLIRPMITGWKWVRKDAE